MNQCELYSDIPGEYGILLEETNVITMTAIDERQTSPRSISNWIFNGDAEIGSCQAGDDITYPTDWNYSGTIMQKSYIDSGSQGVADGDPGPNDRGNCYFFGGQTSISSMWQSVNLTRTINPSLIDNQTVWFNFSAWIGGRRGQTDNAIVSLTFLNQLNQPTGSNTTLGPVLAVDRQNISSLLFRQAGGLVPTGARSFRVTVKATRLIGGFNDGSVDNIAVNFYQ